MLGDDDKEIGRDSQKTSRARIYRFHSRYSRRDRRQRVGGRSIREGNISTLMDLARSRNRQMAAPLQKQRNRRAANCPPLNVFGPKFQRFTLKFNLQIRRLRLTEFPPGCGLSCAAQKSSGAFNQLRPWRSYVLKDLTLRLFKNDLSPNPNSRPARRAASQCRLT